MGASLVSQNAELEKRVETLEFDLRMKDSEKNIEVELIQAECDKKVDTLA